MKTLITILFILTSCAAYSQDLAGQWNGTLQVQGNELKVVFHVTKNNDRYEATFDSPSQNARGIQVTTTAFSYPAVHFEISGIGAAYEGVMTDKSITGKWVQAGTALFLILLKNEDPSQQNK
jgi:hypothetical protein